MSDNPPPAAEPLPRLGWRMQDVLDVLLQDPGREVWPYYVDQRSAARFQSYEVLRRLAKAGWLSTRRETGKVNARVLYRLTPDGEALAREAVARSVKWPAGVSRTRR